MIYDPQYGVYIRRPHSYTQDHFLKMETLDEALDYADGAAARSTMLDVIEVSVYQLVKRIND